MKNDPKFRSIAIITFLKKEIVKLQNREMPYLYDLRGLENDKKLKIKLKSYKELLHKEIKRYNNMI